MGVHLKDQTGYDHRSTVSQRVSLVVGEARLVRCLQCIGKCSVGVGHRHSANALLTLRPHKEEKKSVEESGLLWR